MTKSTVNGQRSDFDVRRTPADYMQRLILLAMQELAYREWIFSSSGAWVNKTHAYIWYIGKYIEFMDNRRTPLTNFDLAFVLIMCHVQVGL